MSLKDDKQQNIQMELDFSSALTGEAREAGREGTESSGATNGTEKPSYNSTNRLMEEVCERRHHRAYKAGTNVIFLEPDLAKVFTDSALVNRVLRLLLKLAKENIPTTNEASDS